MHYFNEWEGVREISREETLDEKKLIRNILIKGNILKTVGYRCMCESYLS